VALAALLAAACLASAPDASADADPASDYLIAQDFFFPLASTVSKPLANQLVGLLAEARRKGAPVKVALIGDPRDLGGVTNAFGRPKQYASFLGKEISFNHPQPLLVVMPNGFGLYGLPAKANAAVKGVKAAGGPGDSLARQAVGAVQRIAAALGKHVKAPKLTAASAGAGSKGASSSAHGGGSPAVFLVPVLLVAAAAGAAAVVTRRRAREPGD
jgi:hypothetical protein